MNLAEKISGFEISKPDSVAIYHPQFTITWRQLNDFIYTHTNFLVSQGIQKNHLVGIFHPRPLVNLISSIALMRLGIPFIDITHGDRDLGSIKKKLSITHVITDNANHFPDLNSILIDKLMNGNSKSKNVPKIQKDETALFVKTSGTTSGISKFLSMTYDNVFNRFDGYTRQSGYAEKGIFWTPISVSFTSSKLRYLSALMNGTSIVAGIGLNRQGINYLNEIKANKLYCTPSQLFKFVEIGIPMNEIESIEAGTAFVNEDLRTNFKEKVSKNLFIIYGATEVGPATLADPVLQLKSPNTVGVPIPGTDVQVVDENDCPVPTGTSGMVRIKSPGMCVSYFQDTSSTQSVFRDGWFYPGDLGYLDTESSLILLGRSDDMMICDGVNIHPSEIENVLSSHPALIDVLAFSVSHKKYGDIPVAAVIQQYPVSEIELIQFCAEKISYQTPRKIIFVKSFPRNEMGKVVRRNLHDYFSRELSSVT